jgi:hypothetical protein
MNSKEESNGRRANTADKRSENEPWASIQGLLRTLVLLLDTYAML